ncbi:MAG: hypothetical protein KC917_16165, partial [Candidatus Omnitrophica bacterium]|nr:hypothetical protein [Candidatus Omnitrophota bacterium]
SRHVQMGENIFDPIDQFGLQTTCVSTLIKTLQAAMSNRADHELMYHVTLHGTTSFPQVTLQKKLLDCRFIVGLYLANALPEECA